MAATNDQKAFVNIVRLMGGDVSVVNSAARSIDRPKDHELSERERVLVRRMMRQREGRAFDHAIFTFYIKCPVFIARVLMREQIGRFDDLGTIDPTCYVPRRFRVRDSSPSGSSNAPDDYNDVARQQFVQAISYVDDVYDYMTRPSKPTKDQLRAGVEPGLGIDPEQAAIILPMGVYTELRWTVSARELMRFITVYSRKTEMIEIQVYAAWFDKMLENSMPVTYAAFVEGGRVAP